MHAQNSHGIRFRAAIEAALMEYQTDNAFAGAGSFVVLGASGGIGAATARGLASRGARVVLASRHRRTSEELDVPGEAVALECDVTDPAQLADCMGLAADFGDGRVAGVALCVGSILLKPAHLTSDAEWRDVLELNLTSAFHVARVAGKTMRQGGSVVFCSSAASAVGLANHDAIAAAKAGVEGLARSAAATYALRGLRFNVVAPGLVRTAMSESITSSKSALEASRAMHALGRIGEPGDVASAIIWLLDPRNDWISGQVLRVDGGLSNLRPVPRR